MSTLNLLSVVFSNAYFLINKELFEWKITHLVFWWIEGFECSVILAFRGHFFRNIYHLLTETLYIKKLFFCLRLQHIVRKINIRLLNKIYSFIADVSIMEKSFAYKLNVIVEMCSRKFYIELYAQLINDVDILCWDFLTVKPINITVTSARLYLKLTNCNTSIYSFITLKIMCLV